MLTNFSYTNTAKKSGEQHPFHLVDPSPWPFFIAIFLFSNALFFITWLHDDYQCDCTLMWVVQYIYLVFFFLTVVVWFNNIVLEATFEGQHTRRVQRGLRFGMLLFIVSEVFFFLAFFWAFFHSSIIPSIWIGGVWPPQFIIPLVLNPLGLPLLNTLILLSSGISVTWAHRAMVINNPTARKNVIQALIITIFYGLLFTSIQRYEYINAGFDITDSIYGSVFYAITGLHGLHVLVGTIFLLICLLRHLRYHFTREHHFGFEAAIWYWHFVDVVWLFLYIAVYCWSS